jgi:hypothetical protein
MSAAPTLRNHPTTVESCQYDVEGVEGWGVAGINKTPAVHLPHKHQSDTPLLLSIGTNATVLAAIISYTFHFSPPQGSKVSVGFPQDE